MDVKRVLKFIGYTLVSIIFLIYIGQILMQIIKGFRMPYKVPIDYFPIKDMLVMITTPSSLMPILMISCCITAAVAYKIYGSSLLDGRGFKYSGSGTYGTARWMNKEEMIKTFRLTDKNSAEGIILGKDNHGKLICLPKDTYLNKNVAIYGAPGTRKSRSFARPMIFERMRAGESMVITDPKGELYRDTSAMLEKAGYTVKVLNLKSFPNSDSWNCLGEIIGEEVDLMAATFTDIVIKNTTESINGNPFWDDAESNLLKALVLYVGHSKHWQGKRTIGEVYRLLSKTSAERLDEMFDQVSMGDPCKQPYNIFKQSGNLRPNIILGLATRMQVFQNEVVCKATSLDDIDLTLPGKEPCAYFVIMSDQQGTFDFLASLFFSFLFIKLVDYADSLPQGKLPVKTYFIMDEFPNIGQIPDFQKKISTVRSRDISISIIFQNLAQLQNRYPHGVWEEILGNCDTQLFLGCTDQTTAKYISARTGEITIDVSTHRETRKTIAVAQFIPEYQISKGDGKRLLMTMDEVMRLDRDELLIIINSLPVLKAKKFDFSDHPLASQIGESVHTDHVPQWKMPDPINMSHLKPAPAPDTSVQSTGVANAAAQEDAGTLKLMTTDGKVVVVDTATGEICTDERAVNFLMSMLKDDKTQGGLVEEKATHEKLKEEAPDSGHDFNAELAGYIFKKKTKPSYEEDRVPAYKKDKAQGKDDEKIQQRKEAERKESLPPVTIKIPEPEDVVKQEYKKPEQPAPIPYENITHEKEESVRAKKIGNLKFQKVEYEGNELADDFID